MVCGSDSIVTSMGRVPGHKPRDRREVPLARNPCFRRVGYIDALQKLDEKSDKRLNVSSWSFSPRSQEHVRVRSGPAVSSSVGLRWLYRPLKELVMCMQPQAAETFLKGVSTLTSSCIPRKLLTVRHHSYSIGSKPGIRSANITRK